MRQPACSVGPMALSPGAAAQGHTMKRLALLATCGAALLTITAADAQRPGGPRGPGPGGPGLGGPGPAGFGLLEFDANADGRLTRAEFDAAQKARFDRLDANKDGQATPEEARAGHEAMAKEAMAERQKARFAELDTDKNGQLSQAEFAAGAPGGPNGRNPRMAFAPSGPGPRMAFARGGPGGPGFAMNRGPRPDGAVAPGQPGGPPGGPPAGAPARAGRADADRNGSISFAEFSARGVEAFVRADADKNNVVTVAELQKLTGGPR